MKLTNEEGNDIIWGDHPDWKMVEDTHWKDDEIYKQMQGMYAIFEHKPSGKFYSLDWTHHHNDFGCDPFEYSDPDPIEVVKKVITRTITEDVWEKV